jgi:glycosyltransferase involved in cell wall biosynthesis
VKRSQRVLILASLSSSLVNFRGVLLREMVARGHTVIAVAPFDEYFEQSGRVLSIMGVALHAVPMTRGGLNPWQDLQSYHAIVKLFRAHQPDVVFAYTAKPVIYGGMAARKVGAIRYYPMITGLGYAFTDGGGFKRKIVRTIVKILYRKGLATSDAVIFQNPDDHSFFRELKLLPHTTLSTCVHGSGVDLMGFPPMPLPVLPIFLMLARLVADKGVREYVAAAKQVKLRYPNAIFRLAGGLDPNPASIKPAELQSWLNDGVIEYLGAVQQVQAVLAECRFYVLPSYREGTPRSVLESLATARPVITTDVPGCRETVIHGENGLLVPPQDAEALAEAMIQLIEMPEVDLQRMADASLKLARDKYDVHKVNFEILQVMGL